jgi:hypothetical protein
MYVPAEPKKARSGQVRQGFWLDDTDQPEGIYALRGSEAIQKKNAPRIKDVAVMHDFPFRRLVRVNTDGDEVKNTVRFLTQRPLLAAELLAAIEDMGGGDDDDDDEEDDRETSSSADDSDKDTEEDSTSEHTDDAMEHAQINTPVVRHNTRPARSKKKSNI